MQLDYQRSSCGSLIPSRSCKAMGTTGFVYLGTNYTQCPCCSTRLICSSLLTSLHFSNFSLLLLSGLRSTTGTNFTAWLDPKTCLPLSLSIKACLYILSVRASSLGSPYCSVLVVHYRPWPAPGH